MNVRNLDTDRLTILSRSFLQNNTLRARTLSKALEPCAHSQPALSALDIHILAYLGRLVEEVTSINGYIL